MKAFGKKILLFAVLFYGITAGYLYLFPMAYHSKEYPLWYSKIHFLSDSANSYHNFIIGDSRAMAGILPRQLSEQWYNLAIGGATSIEGFYTLKNVLEKQSIDTLVLSYSPYHLEFADCFWDRSLKYDYLSSSQFLEIIAQSKHREESFWDKPGSNEPSSWKKYIEGYLIQSKWLYYYKDDLRKSHFINNYKNNHQILQEVQEQRGQFYFGRHEFSEGVSQEGRHKNFVPRQVFRDYLIQTLQLAREKQIVVYYACLPFNENSSKLINAKYRKNYDTYFTALAQAFPEVHFQSQIQMFPNDHFGDPSHLNPRGAKAFTASLKKQWN